MMAVHTSNVEPLPHQITAVYESMLPRQPLRFVLADDPGAGKTIMAGLYIRELIMRADSRRILVVAPGSLVEQWRDELFEKFGLQFNVFSSALEVATPTGNPFEDLDHHDERRREPRGDGAVLVYVLGLDDEISTQLLLGLCNRDVGGGDLAAADQDGPGGPRGLQRARNDVMATLPDLLDQLIAF